MARGILFLSTLAMVVAGIAYFIAIGAAHL
jgi:hypothetical protein